MRILIILFFIQSIHSAKLNDIPVMLELPNGTSFECLTSGDEYYHWLHDNKGYTIVQSPDDGYYYYANKISGVIAPSNHLAHLTDPTSVNIAPFFNEFFIFKITSL